MIEDLKCRHSDTSVLALSQRFTQQVLELDEVALQLSVSIATLKTSIGVPSLDPAACSASSNSQADRHGS
jgi:hypothetical protein